MKQKIYLLGKNKVKIIKSLEIKDKEGNWIQIEYLSGDNKGNRAPDVMEKLKE